MGRDYGFYLLCLMCKLYCGSGVYGYEYFFLDEYCEWIGEVCCFGGCLLVMGWFCECYCGWYIRLVFVVFVKVFYVEILCRV